MKLPRSLGFFDSAGSRKHSPFAHPPVSAMLAGTTPPARKLFLSKLYSPAYASPVNASPACYQVSTHDSGSKWVASPSSSGTFIQYFMSVYPDAFAGSYNAWVAQRGEANTGGMTPNQLKRRTGESGNAGASERQGETTPLTIVLPLNRSRGLPFPARLFGSNLNNSPIKGSLD